MHDGWQVQYTVWMKDSEQTDFGYQAIPAADKAGKVAEVFRSVAPKYDVMNDLMSFGLHRGWKSLAVRMLGLKPGQRVLDVAGGTGDMAWRMAKKVGPHGQVVLTDINDAMLRRGRDRLLDRGIVQQLQVVQADAETLPFKAGYFDCVTIAFGLRNVTDKARALAAMHQVLKPGGQLLILEFSTPALAALRPIYDAYSFNILPKLGAWVAGDAESYQYLAESIRRFPDQSALADMLRAQDFVNVRYLNLSGGIVAIHQGNTC